MWQESLRYPLDGQRSLRGSGGVSGPFGAKSRKPRVVQSEGRKVPGLYWGPRVLLGCSHACLKNLQSLPSCSLTVSLTLICFSHHILVILSHQHRAAHPLPGFIQVDLFGLAWDRIHVQPGCPGVMAPVLGSERDGCGLASGNVHLGGQLRSPRNRGYSQRTSRVNGSLRLTLTGFRASHT